MRSKGRGPGSAPHGPPRLLIDERGKRRISLRLAAVFFGVRVRAGRTAAIRLLIADDEDMFAELVESLFASDDRFEVVGRARDGKEAVALARALAPDVIVMDIGMPTLDGIEATRR